MARIARAGMRLAYPDGMTLSRDNTRRPRSVAALSLTHFAQAFPMLHLPTYFWPVLIAVIAAIAGKLLSGRVKDDPGSFPGWILYAVAIGCVVVGFATLWLDRNA